MRYAYALTKDKGRAKKIGEECLAGLLSQFPPISRPQLEVWLFKDCRKRALSETPYPPIFDGYFPTEELNVLNMALIGLEADQQEILWLKYRDQLDVDQIGQVLQLTQAQVEEKLKEATRTLIQETTDLEPDEEIISHFSQSLADELGHRPREGLTTSQIAILKQRPEPKTAVNAAPPANWNLLSVGSTVAATIAIVAFMLAPREPEVFEPPQNRITEARTQQILPSTPLSAPAVNPTPVHKIPDELKKEFNSASLSSPSPANTKVERPRVTRAPQGHKKSVAQKPKPSVTKKIAHVSKRKSAKKVRL